MMGCIILLLLIRTSNSAAEKENAMKNAVLKNAVSGEASKAAE